MNDVERPDSQPANKRSERVQEDLRDDDTSGESISTEALVDGDTIGSELRDE
jgi:hypothetical protein